MMNDALEKEGLRPAKDVPAAFHEAFRPEHRPEIKSEGEDALKKRIEKDRKRAFGSVGEDEDLPKV